MTNLENSNKEIKLLLLQIRSTTFKQDANQSYPEEIMRKV
jgi:hypothetical protein